MGHLIGSTSPLDGFLTGAETDTRSTMGEEAWWYWFERGWFSGIDGDV